MRATVTYRPLGHDVASQSPPWTTPIRSSWMGPIRLPQMPLRAYLRVIDDSLRVAASIALSRSQAWDGYRHAYAEQRSKDVRNEVGRLAGPICKHGLGELDRDSENDQPDERPTSG